MQAGRLAEVIEHHFHIAGTCQNTFLWIFSYATLLHCYYGLHIFILINYITKSITGLTCVIFSNLFSLNCHSVAVQGVVANVAAVTASPEYYPSLNITDTVTSEVYILQRNYSCTFQKAIQYLSSEEYIPLITYYVALASVEGVTANQMDISTV